MAKATKLPSGNWRCLAYIDGKRKSFTAPTRKEAEFLAAEYVTHTHETKEKSGLTVGEAINRYIQARENVLSPATVRSYYSIARNRLKGIRDIDIEDVTAEQIQQAINEEAKKLAPKTVRNVNGLLSATLREYSPTSSFNVALPKKKKTEMYIPTKEEIETLLLATESDNALYIAILLASNLGLRRGEICALEWEDVKDGYVSVTKNIVRNKNYKWEIKQPKSYSGYRKVPIPKTTLEAINSRRTDENKVVNINPSALTKRFELLIKRTKLPHFTLHSLRHYYASTMLALGIPDKYAMQIMGHATNNMLKNVYQHTKEKEANEFQKKLMDYLG